MNKIEEWMNQELTETVNAIGRDLPPGTLAFLAAHHPDLRSRIEAAEARLASRREELAELYGAWRGALEELQNLWSLAGWEAGQPGAADALKEAA
jgi:hypothetical protein